MEQEAETSRDRVVQGALKIEGMRQAQGLSISLNRHGRDLGLNGSINSILSGGGTCLTSGRESDKRQRVR